MKRWYNRKPETMQDWLLLFAVAAALLAAVWYLPAIAAALRVLLGLATPFAGGLALAYVLDIPARWFAIHLFGGRRGPGILLAYLALFGTVAALVGLVVPQLVQSVGSFAAALPGYLENAQALLELVQANYGVDTTSLSELLLNSGSSVENFLSGLAPQLAQAAMGAAGQVVNGFLALAASVYLLCGKAELLHTARLALRTALPPRTAGNVLGVFAMANKTFSGYIGGQLVDAVLVGGETFVLMLLFGIPYAPLISVVVAVTNIVPMLGPYLGAVPGAALLLFSGQPVHALEFLVIVLVVQQVDGNFIAPRILGGATGLPGLGVLLAIVVGGAWFGIPGMVLGVPVLAVLYLLLSEFVNKRLQKKETVVAAEGPAAAGPEGEQPPPHRESFPEEQTGQTASTEKSKGEAAVHQGDDPEGRIEDHRETDVRKPQEGEEP